MIIGELKTNDMLKDCNVTNNKFYYFFTAHARQKNKIKPTSFFVLLDTVAKRKTSS